MSIQMREYTGAGDLQRMAHLVQQYPEGNLHVADLPYRLSSWAFDYPENIGLWEDDSGRLVAWAVLQTPFWAIDFVLHPDAQEHQPDVLGWAGQRAQQVRDRPGGRPMMNYRRSQEKG